VKTMQPGRRYELKRGAGETPALPSGDGVRGAWAPLSTKQKQVLVVLARQAAGVQYVATEGPDFEEWRREVSVQACGRRISEAVQRDYAVLKSTFEDAAGRPRQALRTVEREVDNKRRQGLWVLRQELQKAGLADGYAEVICRSQFKCAVSEASGKQVWCLVFTVRNRQKTSRRKTQD
jgi:DNA-binding protein